MQCSRLRCYAIVIMGVLSSAGVGGCLAAIGINISGVTVALSNANEEQFARSFALLVIILAVTIVLKSCSEYFMRSVGLLKRCHLNSRIQAMCGHILLGA